MDENDALIKLIEFRLRLQKINYDGVDFWYIEEFHRILDELEKKFNHNLNFCKINKDELDGKPIFGFAKYDFVIDRTKAMEINNPYSVWIDKNKILSKIDILFLIFKKEIKLLSIK